MTSLKDRVTQLEQQAKADEATADSWVLANKGWLIALAVTLLVGLAVGKFA